MITPSEESQHNGMCPAPITLFGLGGRPVTVCCEHGYDHSGPHLSTGLEWTVDRRTGHPRITKRLTRKGAL